MINNSETLQHIQTWFTQQRTTLGFAESCTGGLLSATLSSRAGVSSFFKGAVVSYSADVKINILGVSQKSIAEYGEVSVMVAEQMAAGACRSLNCDWSVAVTGIAGPSGGTVDKPVGTVCFAVCGPGIVMSEKKHIPGKDRVAIQQATAHHALEILCKITGEQM